MQISFEIIWAIWYISCTDVCWCLPHILRPHLFCFPPTPIHRMKEKEVFLFGPWRDRKEKPMSNNFSLLFQWLPSNLRWFYTNSGLTYLKRTQWLIQNQLQLRVDTPYVNGEQFGVAQSKLCGSETPGGWYQHLPAQFLFSSTLSVTESRFLFSFLEWSR